MSKQDRPLEIANDDLWELIDMSLKLFAYKWNIPNGAYTKSIESSKDNIKLILTPVETDAPDPQGDNT